MVFSRLFGGKNEPQGEEPEDEGADDEAPEGDFDEAAEELPDIPWKERAAAVIVGSTSTGSKRAKNLWGSADAHAPSHYSQASGCRIVTPDDETLIDCTMALGSVAIGYADDRITSAVVAAAAAGNVAGLPHVLEIDVAERFCELVPCAERVQFMKSGAEAMAAAVRIARAYTGRSRVVGCGYFGWSDWCSDDETGVPAGVKGDFTRVPFGDVAALEAAVSAAGSNLAAIVIEPVIEEMPSTEWIQRARDLATGSGAALIFDEIKTGFRLAPGGYQEVSGITPDLAAFGKALANGYPLSAVCGLAPLMQAAEKTWISSTLAGETIALAAARAVLAIHGEEKVCEKLAKIGGDMRVAVGNALRAGKLDGISIAGIDPMWFFKFESPELETRFLVASAAQGVLFKRGPYNFAALAHDEETIHEIESCTSNAIVAMRDGLA